MPMPRHRSADRRPRSGTQIGGGALQVLPLHYAYTYYQFPSYEHTRSSLIRGIPPSSLIKKPLPTPQSGAKVAPIALQVVEPL
ncbi:hypothetical protein ACLOJK_027348 [Asimina triloba]